MRDRVTLEYGTGLTQVRYEFINIDGNIYLDRLIRLERPSKRHKFKMLPDSYSRLNDRNCHIKEEPDVDIGIQMDALEKFRQLLKIKKWSDR